MVAAFISYSDTAGVKNVFTPDLSSFKISLLNFLKINSFSPISAHSLYNQFHPLYSINIKKPKIIIIVYIKVIKISIVYRKNNIIFIDFISEVIL